MNAAAPPAVRFTGRDVYHANEAWGFNCGGGAICAALRMTPEEVRPHLKGFERKGHMNRTDMVKALTSIGAAFFQGARNRVAGMNGAPRHAWPSHGIALIQFGGSHMKPGVPAVARGEHTHWVACHQFHPRAGKLRIYDLNFEERWLELEEWERLFVPVFVADNKRRDGSWWLTRVFAIPESCLKEAAGGGE